VKQQINLLNCLPKPEEVTLSFIRLLQISAAFLFIMFFFLIKSQWQLATTKSSYQQAKAEETKIVEQFNGVMKSTGHTSNSTTESFKTKLNLSNVFSDYLEALAEVTPNNIWLKSIEINHHTDLIRLSGSSQNATFIPDFVSALSDTPEFKQGQYKNFQISQSNNSDHVEFLISNDK